MTKPTPGPWRVVHGRNPEQFVVCTDGYEYDASIAYLPGDYPRTALANARLIAASPALYEALEALVLAEEAAGSDGREAERRRAAIAALKKARGES